MTPTEDDPFACFDDSDSDDARIPEESPIDSEGATPDYTDATQKNPIMTAPTSYDTAATASIIRRDPACGVLSFHQNTEQSLLIHVRNDLSGKTFEKNSILQASQAVLTSIDEFCTTRHWMMHVGPQKGAVITSFLESCLEKQTMEKAQFVCVEIGTYCGYASMLLTQTALKKLGRSDVRRFHLYTIEVSEKNASVAKQMIQLANMQEWITVILFQPDKTSLVQLLQEATRGQDISSTTIDFLFLDHDKDLYLSDLQQLEQSGMIQQGTHVAADNVVFARIDEYRAHVKNLADLDVVETRLVESQLEYSEPDQSEQLKQETFVDGVELTVFLQSPKSFMSNG